MSTLGKMSVGVVSAAPIPNRAISSDMTTKVYGFARASLTIHMASFSLSLRRSGGSGFDLDGEGDDRDPAVGFDDLLEELRADRSLDALPSRAGQRGVDESPAERD